MLKKYWDLVVGAIISIYSLILILIWGNISFSYIFLFMGVCILAHHILRKRYKLKGGIKKMHRVVNILVATFLLFFIILDGIIILYPKNNTEKSELLMVLGAGVNGRTPSLTLKGRLDKAVEYVENYDKDIYIIVTGGQGEGEDISEALCMKEYLVKAGISEDKIIMEDKSTSTAENFMYSKKIIKEELDIDVRDSSIKVITNDFHSFRSNMLGERNGYENLNFYSSKTYWPLIPIYYVREAFAFVKSYLLD